MLLSYGQMAAWAKSHILPWVDNILSRMIFYFRFSSWVQVTSLTITPVLHLPQDTARTPALPCPSCSQRSPGPSLACAQLSCPPAKPPVLCVHCPGAFIIPENFSGLIRTPSPTSYKANVGFFTWEGLGPKRPE